MKIGNIREIIANKRHKIDAIENELSFYFNYLERELEGSSAWSDNYSIIEDNESFELKKYSYTIFKLDFIIEDGLASQITVKRNYGSNNRSFNKGEL